MLQYCATATSCLVHNYYVAQCDESVSVFCDISNRIDAVRSGFEIDAQVRHSTIGQTCRHVLLTILLLSQRFHADAWQNLSVQQVKRLV